MIMNSDGLSYNINISVTVRAVVDAMIQTLTEKLSHAAIISRADVILDFNWLINQVQFKTLIVLNLIGINRR